jgi:hypothetical protein
MDSTDTNDGVTMGKFAQLAGLSLSAIRYHAAQGRIKRMPNGKWNPADAEALANARHVKAGSAEPNNAKLLKVRVLAGAMKTRRINLSVNEAQSRTIERQPLEAALREQCDGVTERVGSWPPRYAAALTTELECDPQTAGAILAEFSEIALQELGDIHAEALRLLGRTTANA